MQSMQVFSILLRAFSAYAVMQVDVIYSVSDYSYVGSSARFDREMSDTPALAVQ